MHIIKLSAIDSTNTYLKALGNRVSLKDFTVVISEAQTKGRGQIGTHWLSQPGKNLTFSVFKSLSFLSLDQHFCISMAVSIALSNTLKAFSIKNVQIKWPNDILSEQKKIAGILIENVINQNALKGTIIGIGLNVNQTIFSNLPRATSMRLISGKTYDLDEVLHVFLEYLKQEFARLERKDFNDLKLQYLASLFRKDKPSTFKDEEGELFSGYILGVAKTGNLQVKVEDDIVKEYAFKEIELLY